MGKKLTCLLCDGERLNVIKITERKGEILYLHCEGCNFIFLSKDHRLSPEDEKKRYLLHENTILDPGYQNFVMPLKNEILDRCRPNSIGLDYGAGVNSAISYLLEQSGYSVQRYDPFFNDDMRTLVPESYDYTIICEVAEHFYSPRQEFEKLKSLVKPGGFLFLLTSLKTADIDFSTWSYRRDPTHVCFYSEKAFQWFEDSLGLEIVKIEKPNLIVLHKKG